jgi:hypothetical protein
MRKICSSVSNNLLHLSRYHTATVQETSFLKMVESYFDKAGRHTNIKPDKLNFLKKAENVVKMTLTLVRGTLCLIRRQWQNLDDPRLSMPT